jgi:putative membrane protein
MRIITWVIWLTAFLLLLAFAAKNLEPISLHFYLDQSWEAPLVVVLLAFFAAGAAFGMIATLGTLLRQRREISRLRREVRGRREANARAGAGQVHPPAVDA